MILIFPALLAANDTTIHMDEYFNFNENHDIAIALSSSRADTVLGLNILQG